MGGTQTSKTTSSVAATNPTLQNLFTNIFGGGTGGAPGLATTAAGTLQGAQSGNLLSTNINQLYSTLFKSSQPQFQMGQAQIREQMGKAGLTDSTSLASAEGGYTAQYLSGLTSNAVQGGLQEEQMQTSIAGNLMSLLATAGSQYYTDKSTSSVSMPWTSGFSAVMGGLSGLVSAGTGAQAWQQALNL